MVLLTSQELVSLVSIHVMRGLVPRIHVFGAAAKAWMAGTRGSPPRKRGGVPGPAMTPSDSIGWKHAVGNGMIHTCCCVTHPQDRAGAPLVPDDRRFDPFVRFE